MAPKSEAKALVKTNGDATKLTPKKSEDEDMKEDNATEKAAAETSDLAKEPEEKEEDAAEDNRKKVAAVDVGLSMADSTLNVFSSMDDQLLMCLGDGALQYLLAGVRCTTGLKSGRYMFEAQIVEAKNTMEMQDPKFPAPKHFARIGLSTSGSSVLLAESAEYCCFDSLGFFCHGRKRSKKGQKFSFADTVALVLNLDQSSPNANTVSLFKNGVRASEPQPLPESLKGKTLFPTVAYKNVALRINFGPKPLAQLPFSCRMVKDAAIADAEVVIAPVPANSTYEVLFPVGMPDEGVFEWADQYLEANPGCTEISNRKIVDWAIKSGIPPGPKTTKGSIDSPEMNFGLPLLDDLSVRNVLSAVAPTLDRSFLVMDLKTNLVPAERKEVLARFGAFKKVAVVAMGEPSADYKSRVHEAMIAEKIAKAEAIAEEAKKKKAQNAQRKKLLEEKKRRAEEARKLRAAAAGKPAKEATEEKDAEALLEEEKKAAEEEKKAEEEEKKEDDAMNAEPVAELTEEEKNVWHRRKAKPDLSQSIMAKLYTRFALPDSSEGFDEVRYVWQEAKICTQMLEDWVHERKSTQRVEDIEPGEWFKGEYVKWTKTLSEWKKKQQEWKDPTKKKALLAKKKAEAEKKAEAKKKAEAESGADADGDEVAAEPMEIDLSEIDVFGVEDVTDVLGSGEPLFAEFAYEDWALLSLRVELHLLLHSWKKDLNDPERPSFKENHFAFYYTKYFKKQFDLKNFGVAKLAIVLDWLDVITVDETSGLLEAQTDDDMPVEEFVKYTEEHRRDRQRRIDAGDETATLKFTKPPPPLPAAAQAAAVKRPISAVAGKLPATPAKASRLGAAPAFTPSRIGTQVFSRPSYPAGAAPSASYGMYAGARPVPTARPVPGFAARQATIYKRV